MKWINFENPRTIDEAVKLLADSNGQAKPLAGGTDLIVQLRVGDPRVNANNVIDIKSTFSTEYFSKGSIYNYTQDESTTINSLSLNFSKVSKNISIRNYLHIHLDEKWFSNIYIKKYTNIAPSYDSFVDFLEALSRKNDILITTGLIDFDLVQQLKNKFFTKMSEKIFFKKGINRSIYLILKPSFNDLESLLRHTNILVACHGSITHASNSFSVKKIDILEQSKILFYKRFNSYLDNYNPIYRTSFYILKNEIFEKIENLNN